MLTLQRLPHGPKRFLVDQLHGSPARCVLGASAPVVLLFARNRISRIAGVQRVVSATNDVDEVHALIVPG